MDEISPRRRGASTRAEILSRRFAAIAEALLDPDNSDGDVAGLIERVNEVHAHPHSFEATARMMLVEAIAEHMLELRRQRRNPDPRRPQNSGRTVKSFARVYPELAVYLDPAKVLVVVEWWEAHEAPPWPVIDALARAAGIAPPNDAGEDAAAVLEQEWLAWSKERGLSIR